MPFVLGQCLSLFQKCAISKDWFSWNGSLFHGKNTQNLPSATKTCPFSHLQTWVHSLSITRVIESRNRAFQHLKHYICLRKFPWKSRNYMHFPVSSCHSIFSRVIFLCNGLHSMILIDWKGLKTLTLFLRKKDWILAYQTSLSLSNATLMP